MAMEEENKFPQEECTMSYLFMRELTKLKRITTILTIVVFLQVMGKELAMLNIEMLLPLLSRYLMTVIIIMAMDHRLLMVDLTNMVHLSTVTVIIPYSHHTHRLLDLIEIIAILAEITIWTISNNYLNKITGSLKARDSHLILEKM
jgi:hypothetical protein